MMNDNTNMPEAPTAVTIGLLIGIGALGLLASLLVTFSCAPRDFEEVSGLLAVLGVAQLVLFSLLSIAIITLIEVLRAMNAGPNRASQEEDSHAALEEAANDVEPEDPSARADELIRRIRRRRTDNDAPE